MKTFLYFIVASITMLVFFEAKGQGPLLSPRANNQDQLTTPSFTYLDSDRNVPIYRCEAFDIDAMVRKAESDSQNGVSPFIFAKKFYVDLTPENSGVWIEKDDLRIWRLEIESANAYAMMLIFNDLNLPANSSLFVYNKDRSYVAGPYTESYSKNKVLPTPLIPGSSIIVELSYFKDKVRTKPSFKIESISHDFYNATGTLEFRTNDLECHNDINCPEGDNWQVHKRSVMRMVLDGNSFCSGALINTTESEGRSFVLTANHCIDDNEEANSAVFYFNYEFRNCEGDDLFDHHMIMSGAQIIASNPASDFMLLELNSRVPSSFEPYFAGWNRTPFTFGGRAFYIHHPRGCEKKISFENTGYTANFEEQMISEDVFQPLTLWALELDDGAMEGGSSGAPLFDLGGRIIGQHAGGFGRCPEDEGRVWSGRLSASWNEGVNDEERLRDWLSPNNNDPLAILGFAPQGYLHAWLGRQQQNSVHSAIKSIAVGEGNQVFYRGADNKMQNYYWSNGRWNHGRIGGPLKHNVTGDVVVGEGNQIFYRGQDGRMHTYYWSLGNWHHGWLGWPSDQKVSSEEGSIAIGQGNRLFYRGTDNKMHSYFWSNGSWHHEWVNGSDAPSNENIQGDVVVGNVGEGGHQVFYRGQDGRMHTYWFNGTWNHARLGWPSNQKVSSEAGSIAIAQGNRLFYRGTDNKMHTYFWSNGSWNHDWLNGSNAPSTENVAGDISVNHENQIFYRGTDGRMHTYFMENNEWSHDWLEGSSEAPSIHNVSGSIDVGTNRQIFYRGTDGRCRTYYWEDSFFRSSENYNYYTIYETRPSPTIPVHFQQSGLRISTFPNPVENTLNFRIFAEKSGKFEVSLYDITGNTLQVFTTDDSDTKLMNLENIPSGIIFLKAQDSEGNIVIQKIVKQ